MKAIDHRKKMRGPHNHPNTQRQADGMPKTTARETPSEKKERMASLSKELNTFDPLTIATALKMGEANPTI